MNERFLTNWKEVFSSSVAYLSNKVLLINFCTCQELREEMGREVDEHQHELAALQDAHRQKMADMAKRHRDELAEYEERIEELEEQIQTGEGHFCLFINFFTRCQRGKFVNFDSCCLQELLPHSPLQQHRHHHQDPPAWKGYRSRFAPCARRRRFETRNAAS